MPSSSALPSVVDAAGIVRSGDRVRLLLLTDTSIFSPGGSERFLRNLAARLPADRYDITVVQLSEPTHAWPDSGADCGIGHVRMHSLPTYAAYGLHGLRALGRLRKLCKRERFHIVQSQHEKSDLFNAFLPREAGSVHISNRRDMGFNKSPRLRWFFRFLNHRYHCVVAPAQPILSGLVRDERLALDRMMWIPNGVDTARFRPDARNRAEQRETLGLREDQVAFGCVARLTEVKRHCDLIDAFARLRTRVPAVRLFFIGDGPLRETLERQIAAAGVGDIVTLLGDRPEVEHLLPALDVATLVSSTEGMSNAILEAMACGLPMVASSVGGNLQLVQDDVTGLLVPPRQPELLAQALARMATSPELRQRMGHAARARIEREFSLDSMVRSFDRLYGRMLADAA